MMFTSSDASSLVRELWWWEHAEYVFGALVAAACAGEYIADFNKRPWVKAHKDRIAKISTLVLVAALVFELICITRANGKSDEVIGKLRDEAEAADNLAQSAVQNSNTALGTSATALSQAKGAVTKSGKAADSLGKAEAEANKAQSASSIAQQKAGQVATQADALTTRMESASKKLGVLEQDIVAQGPRSKLLFKAASELVKQLEPFAGQRAQLFVCGKPGVADQETMDTWGAIANILGTDGAFGTSGAKWKLVPTNLSFFDRCFGPSHVGQGLIAFVSKGASKSTMEAAKILSDGLTKTLPPSPDKMLSIADPDFQRFRDPIEGKDTPWAIVVDDPDLITVLIGAHPQQCQEISKTKTNH